MEDKGTIKYLLFMPSFYGLVMFSFGCFLYHLNLYTMEEKLFETQIIFVLAILFFLTATIVQFKSYRNQLLNAPDFSESIYKLNKKKRIIFISFAVIGIYGLYLYVTDFSVLFGGVSQFFQNFVSDSASIRIAQAETTSSGFQLSYFSWIVAALLMFEIALKRISYIHLIWVFIILFANSLFIDRTRPVWIILFLALIFLFIRYRAIPSRKIIRLFIYMNLSFILLFVALGEWIGKVTTKDEYGYTIVPVTLQPLVHYNTTPYAYFNRFVGETHQFTYRPINCFYPLNKLISSLGLIEEPPSQILDFYYIPQPVNVGTFLEPLYRDGGIVFLILGMFLHSFIFNYWGLFFLKNPTRLGVFALTNLCYVNFMSFFSPKFHNAPIWLFLILGLISVLNKKYFSKPVL
jgi:oligosaccharide repeat unit polymerase